MKILTKNEENWVTPSEMNDGEIGIIRKWDPEMYAGDIVQKSGSDLLCLGQISGNHFTKGGKIDTRDCLIEILPPGSTLEI